MPAPAEGKFPAFFYVLYSCIVKISRMSTVRQSLVFPLGEQKPIAAGGSCPAAGVEPDVSPSRTRSSPAIGPAPSWCRARADGCWTIDSGVNFVAGLDVLRAVLANYF
jgi:hypothetical protein